MQSKGFIKFVAVLCFLASIWQLSFTFVTAHIESKAKKDATDASGIIDEAKEAEILRNRRNEKVWMGYTYKECKDKEISLGLDLKGGMNVMMEISLPDVVKALANESADPAFTKAIAQAQLKEKSSTADFLTLFEQSWNEAEPGARMARVFGTFELRDKIKPETSNSDVMKVLREQAESAVANSFKVLRSRIDRFGVASPNIQRIGSSGRIMVELPGVKDADRVRKLLQGTANLEFWETYENSEIYPLLEQANTVIKEILDARKKEQSADADTAKPEVKEPDVLAVSDSLTLAAAGDSLDSDSLLASLTDSLNMQNDSLSLENFPLFRILSPSLSQNGKLMPGACIGYATTDNMEKIDEYLSYPQVRALFPANFQAIWSFKAVDKGETTYQLVAIKRTNDGKPPLDGSVVTGARVTTDPTRGFGVSMDMNGIGSAVWARVTADNIGKSVAIVLDGLAYSWPKVDSEIKGGSSSITGSFTSNEATDLANVLESGKMPAPAKIVQEAVVGPSLGQESINSGFISFLLAFVLVLIYMWVYYSSAGLTANIALLTNLLLILGVLTSFGAVLTLPGIAGIVLTLGMAVDANIIIYERIKEELRLGKSVRMAVSEGYKHAMSAILDGQLTTLLMAIVLYFYSSGPVQGFATTLGIGIITSLATSIFISRLVVEWMLKREMNVKFGNKYTFDFLEHTKFDFLKYRKAAYILSTALCVIGVTFMLTKGFSLGVDFSGGRSYTVKFDQEVNVEEVRASIAESFDESAIVKQFGPANQLKITTKYRIEDDGETVDYEVANKLYDATHTFFANDISSAEFLSTETNPFGVVSSEKVGPTIADDMQTDSIIAILLTLLIIFLYITFRFNSWSWGTGAVIAMSHDGLLTIALFSVCAGWLPWSMDIDQHFIAAVLTVIGYSINDTVIIFDRIRENRKLYPKRDWYSTVNDAINSTLMRSVNTALTVLVVLLAIFIFGGETIRGFAFSMLFGVTVGVYSTIFIAIPIAYDFIQRKHNKTVAKEPVKPTLSSKKK